MMVPCECQLAWVGQGETDSLDLANIVVKVLCKAASYPGELPQAFSCLLGSWILATVPRVFPVFVNNFLPASIEACFGLPYPMVHASCLLMVAIVTSMRLPMIGATIEAEFLRKFFNLQAQLLTRFAEFQGGKISAATLVPHPTQKGAALPSDVPYSLVFRFFYFTQSDPVLGPSIRSLAAYILGQCLLPPFELLELLSNTVMDIDTELREIDANF